MRLHLSRNVTRQKFVGVASVIALATLAVGVSNSYAAAPNDTSAGLKSVFRMDAGGDGFTDNNGQRWRADHYAQVANGGEHSVTNAIDGTVNDKLFQSERWGMTGYNIPMSNGSYRVRLMFAEVNPSSGTRVFDVKQGSRVLLQDFNIQQEAGAAYKAVWEEFGDVAVTDGYLHLSFVKKQNMPSIAGIEVLKPIAATSTSTTTAPTSTTAKPTTTTVRPTTTTTAKPVITTTTAKPTTTTAAPSMWTLKFQDDFNTNATAGQFLSKYKNWGAYATGAKDTAKVGIMDNSILSVSNGVLHMNLHTGSDGVPRGAGPYPLINGGSQSNPDANQLYGRYEVRFKADETPGYATAWLLWPKSETWPRDGEIDFPEGSLDGTIHAFMHRQGGTSGGDQDAFNSSARFGTWHTLALEWLPGKVNFIIDGVNVGTSTKQIPNTPMHWVLQTETAYGQKPAVTATSDVQIDYVKVWSYTP